MDFLSESNHCGQTLLNIVAKGNAIIAEMLRLSHHIPPVFQPLNDPNFKIDVNAKYEQKKYEKFLFNFSYIKKQDYYENVISTSSDLIDLDSEFRDNHMPILERFYLLFENLYKYATDFKKFLEELDNGVVFVQQTFEGILVNQDGKQLLAEALYLYGVMLLIMDMKIPGIVRERMLMSYYRYKGQGEIPNIDEVCKLCAKTRYNPLSSNDSEKTKPKPKSSYFSKKKKKK